MSQEVYYDTQIDQSLLAAKKVAVIGYGAQGRAHALNLRDSGIDVTIGQRPSRGEANSQGSGYDNAVADGFSPVSVSEAAKRCDFLCIMLPDEVHGEVFDSEIRDHLSSDTVLLCCHGFSFLYELIKPPAGNPCLLVAPKGAGHMVRTAYENGGGVACLAAVAPGTDRETFFPLALSYAAAIGGGKAGVFETSVAEETETDLFGEQAVLCGGVSHLAIAAFETLVEAGYREEVAYFECVHELKLVVDLLHRGGLAFMRDHISNTAEYGDYSRGPRIIDQHVRDSMKSVLKDIQDGTFAKQWIAETKSGGSEFQKMRQSYRDLSMESTGKKLIEILNPA